MDFVVPRVGSVEQSTSFWQGKRVLITSKWSGCAGMDIALHLWKLSMEARGCNVIVETFSFTEWEPRAQALLSRFPCRHMFGDINEQFDPKLRKTIMDKQRDIRNLYLLESSVRGTRPAQKAALKQEAIENFLCFLEMTLASSDADVPTSAGCLLRGTGSLVPDDPDCIWIDCGSPSCKSWSPRGSRLKWLSEDNIGTILWGDALARTSARCPDIIFGENVREFDFEFWTTLSQGRYGWHSTNVGPYNVGLPVSGDRLWWCGVGNSLSLATPELLAPERVQKTIFRRIIASPNMWLNASQAQLEAHENVVNAHGARLAPHPRNKRCRPEDYLSTNAQLRLLEHRRNACAVRSKVPALHEVEFFYDISQHVSHSRSPNGWLPRPTTSSCVWAEGAGRLLHPLELWSSQGPTEIMNCISGVSLLRVVTVASARGSVKKWCPSTSFQFRCPTKS